MKLFLSIFLFLFMPAVALASGGNGNAPADVAVAAISYTKMQTATFEIFDYEGDTEVDNLGIDFSDLDFISYVGSVAATTVALVSDKAALTIWVVIFIALLAMIWLLSIVMNRRMDAQLREAVRDLPSNEQLFELADDRTEYQQLVSERDREIRVRQARVRGNRLTERISRSRLFGGVRGIYQTGGSVHRLSRGGGDFRRRR